MALGGCPAGGAAACSDTGDLEERVAALEARPATIVGHVAEVLSQGQWFWVSRVLVAEKDLDDTDTPVFSVSGRTARVGVIIADPAFSEPYTVYVSLACYDLARVGDP